MKYAWIIAVVLPLSGCATAEFISTHGDDKSAYAPTNEAANRGGVMRYGVGNLGHMKRGREDAYRKMSRFCKGPYSIQGESMGSQNTGMVPIGGVYFNAHEESIYLSFKCE